ncbi:MAG TPA: ATP synthase F1 subunit delta [Salinivirgaceae bacterium]|nr:ATP synthase F1 subunit delta [Salinivirgaceae bacterium]
MDQSAIPVRYAKALFELSIEQNIEEDIYKDIIFVNQIIADNTDFLPILCSRAILQSDKIKILKEIIEPHVNELTYRFLKHIVRKRREVFITRMLLEFIKCYNQRHNIIQVTVKSAITLTSEHVDKIKNTISEQTGKTPIMSYSVDRALIGGYQVFIDDRFYDMSVKGMLNKIEQSF